MKNALLIIDVQREMVNEHTKDLPVKIAEFINEKRNLFDYIIFFKFQNQPGSNWFNIMKWEGMTKDSEIELAAELVPIAGNATVFIKKTAFSVFRVDEFVQWINNKKINRLFFCGMDTDVCVYTSLMEAFERNYEVKVIENLCAASHGQKNHENALDLIRTNLGRRVLITTDEFSQR